MASANRRTYLQYHQRLQEEDRNARLCSKAAKNDELLERDGDELEGETATMFRAVASMH